MTTLLIYPLAALAEIAGCLAFWCSFRLGTSKLWLVPGCASLVAFAWLLTHVPSDAAGRAYAAYGGVYIVASLLWLWTVEGTRPDRWDTIGAAVSRSSCSGHVAREWLYISFVGKHAPRRDHVEPEADRQSFRFERSAHP